MPDAGHSRRRQQDLARLSEHPGRGRRAAVNAKDRIGKGPWTNAKGVVIATSVEDLHSPNNKIAAETNVAEIGRLIPSRLYTVTSTTC